MIYTGPVDEFFDYRFGKLPYRSLEFKLETLDTSRASAGRRSSTIRTTTPTPGSPSSSTSPARSTRRPAGLRVPARRGRSVLPGAAAGERRALSSSTRRSPTRRRACTSSAGWRPTSTTTWTRSSRRRSRHTRGWSDCRDASCSARDGLERRSCTGPGAGAVGRRRVHRQPRRRSLSRSGRAHRSCRPARRPGACRRARDSHAALSGALGARGPGQSDRRGLALDATRGSRELRALGIAPDRRPRAPRQRARLLDAARSRLPRAARRSTRGASPSGIRGSTPTRRSTSR